MNTHRHWRDYALGLVALGIVAVILTIIRSTNEIAHARSLSYEHAVDSLKAETERVDHVSRSDSLRREARVNEILLRMNWLDSLRHDRPKLCQAVMRNFDSIEGDVDMSVRQYDPTDLPGDSWKGRLYITAARFLRYDCYDLLGRSNKMLTQADRDEFLAYVRAARLVYILDQP